MTWIVFIQKLIGMMGPELRTMLLQLVNDWEKKAAETKDNPFDDLLVMLIKIALDIK